MLGRPNFGMTELFSFFILCFFSASIHPYGAMAQSSAIMGSMRDKFQSETIIEETSGKSLFRGGGGQQQPQKQHIERNAIVGGTVSDPDRYPYAVALLKNNSDVAFCGGALISDMWVLTAGHCRFQAERVHIGRHNFSDDNATYEEIAIEQEFVHPRYDDFLLDYDYMLIKLQQPSTAPPVKLHEGPEQSSGNHVPFRVDLDLTIMGWGTTSFLGPQSDVLMEVEVDYVLDCKCHSRYYLWGGITDSMMCAARKDSDSCQGDSGGPLVRKAPDSMAPYDDVMVGLVSWGIGCGTRLLPGVYSDVQFASHWISGYVKDAEFVPLNATDYSFSGRDCVSNNYWW